MTLETALDDLSRRGFIRQRSRDIPRVRSLLASSQAVSAAALQIELREATATIIFRELYESVRQLGDAILWANGYETDSHEAALRTLAEAVPETGSLAKLDRFRKIRNDANYQGYLASLEQAKEITAFWKRSSPAFISYIEQLAAKR